MLALTWTGCDLLDVENPNNLIEDELDNPAAATPMANGVEASTTRALQAILAPYSTATDELTWVGSRDAWQQLDFGNVDDPFNEFTDVAFPYVGEARWLADNFFERLTGFASEGASVGTELARVSLYRAIMYVTIADMFDDFTFSERTEGAPAIGPSNMVQLYDQAIDGLTASLANLEAGTDLHTQVLAMRASARHRKGIWQKVNPSVDTGSPLVVDAGAAEDALAVIGAVGLASDWKYELVIDGSVEADLVVGGISMGTETNDRLELRVGATYVQPDSDGNQIESVTFADVIDTGTVYPETDRAIMAFTDAKRTPNMTIVSEREMHLILAEHELASGNMDGFTTHVNHIRVNMDNLTPYSGQVEAQAMLNFMRQANLVLQGRRLSDHYRFDDPSPEWIPSEDALQSPGTFLPITVTEITANPNIN
ncbi:MAG: hypothetical protein AAF970_04460 [Bacteroidota bacterium]